MVEVWVSIPDTPDYEISSQGRARRATPGHITRPGNILKPSPGKGGYMRVTVTLASGRRKPVLLHRLVCILFHGPPPFFGAQVAHLDGNPAHNAEDNLRWKTAQGNADDRDLHNRTARGERAGAARLTEAEVLAIRASQGTCRDVGKRYGVSKATISRVRTRTYWRHLPG